MEKMTKAEYLAFLSDRARCAKLATVREDGRPHVVPVWFTLHNEEIIFTAGYRSVKVRNILRDGRVAICVDDDTPPFHYVLLEGRAEILNSSVEAARHWGAIIGGRYMGTDRAEEFGRRYGVEGEWVMRMIPDKVIAYKDIV
ncbi:MAG TPA: PPOX class F420-dependent oxidoreductase [Anaerolineales bacterium]|nr:PPOX class F420-dependent oxidoreductase [Anaerolineales bacterium]